MKFLYEKDLRQMKYNILTSTRHDETVRAIAERLGMGEAKLRRTMLRRFDMSLLENLESRWQMGQEHADNGDPVAEELGYELFTLFIPLVDTETMQTIYSDTTAMTQQMPFEEAIARGRARIREAILA